MKISILLPGDKKPALFSSKEAVADAYGAAREARLAQDKVVAALKERETALAAWLIDNVPKSDATGAMGREWIAKTVPFETPQAQDWSAVFAFAKKHDRFDLFQRRLNETAVKEIWDKAVEEVRNKASFRKLDESAQWAAINLATQKALPGVVKFLGVKISLSKVK